MADIVVTTPKNRMEEAAQEAETVKENGGGYYFRVLESEPSRGLGKGDKVFFVEDGFVRGYCNVVKTEEADEPMTCEVTGYNWPAGFRVWMEAKSWKWIEPIRKQGFQGFQYFNQQNEVKEIGGWLDDRPERSEG